MRRSCVFFLLSCCMRAATAHQSGDDAAGSAGQGGWLERLFFSAAAARAAELPEPPEHNGRRLAPTGCDSSCLWNKGDYCVSDNGCSCDWATCDTHSRCDHECNAGCGSCPIGSHSPTGACDYTARPRCQACAAGTTGGGGAGPLAACSACSTCGRGQRLSSACSTTRDTQCTSCGVGTFRSSWSHSESSCTACSAPSATCDSDEYITQNDCASTGSVRDRGGCTSCAIECNWAAKVSGGEKIPQYRDTRCPGSNYLTAPGCSFCSNSHCPEGTMQDGSCPTTHYPDQRKNRNCRSGDCTNNGFTCVRCPQNTYRNTVRLHCHCSLSLSLSLSLSPSLFVLRVCVCVCGAALAVPASTQRP